VTDPTNDQTTPPRQGSNEGNNARSRKEDHALRIQPAGAAGNLAASGGDMTQPESARLDEEQSRVTSLVERVGGVQIDTAEQNAAAAVMLGEIKGRAKDMDTLRRSMTRPLDDAKRRIMDLFRPIEQQLADAEQHIKGQMLAFARQEQRRLDAERAAADAERQRLTAEAIKAAEEGRYTDAVVAAEEYQAVPEPPRAPARAAGTSIVPTYRAEVTDLAALVLAVASGAAPLSMVRADESALGAYARATKQEGEVFPGVRFYREDSVRAQAAGLR
jgi:hypothetical protein